MTNRRERDTARMDWLEAQIVDVIHLDDFRIIDVRGHSVRDAIDKAMAAVGESRVEETKP